MALALALKKTTGAVEKYGLTGDLYGIAGPALIAAALLIIGGVVFLRLRAGVKVPATMVAGLVLAVAGGVLSAVLPLVVALAVFAVGLGVAAVPRGGLSGSGDVAVP